MKKSIPAFLLILLAATTACSDNKEFRIEGTVRGLGTRPVTLEYVTAGTVRTSTVTAIDSKFFFTGTTRDYAIAEISAADRLLASFIVRNGDNLKCELDIDNPADMTISGNKPSEQVSQFMADNAQILADQNQAALDSAIEAYVIAHPDRTSSAMLLMTMYGSSLNPARADSLMSLINPGARPASLTADYRIMLAQASDAQTTAKVRMFTLPSDGDSLENFVPSRHRASILYFRGHEPGRHDTIVPILRKLRAQYNHRSLHIVEIGMVADTLQWARMTSPRDSITWTRVFAPGGRTYSAFEPVGIPRLPFLIVADDNGNQIYRGQSATTAAETASRHIEQ